MGAPSNGNANSKEDKSFFCNKKLPQPASTIASSGENTLGDCSRAPMEIPSDGQAVEEALNPLERETKGTDSAPVKPLEPPDATRETYTVPSYARWFSWNKIHEIERKALKDFFDGSSSSKTPKIYKEYRDFMINMYREDPHRGLTLTEMRKMLIGDVNSLHKIFNFLETWGLINFQVSSNSKLEQSSEDAPIVFDNVTPSGIFAGLPSNPVKRVHSSNIKSSEVDRTVRAIQGTALASYKDVFNEVTDMEVSTVSQRALTGSETQSTLQRFCNNCRTECTTSHFDCNKQAGFVLCTKCFQDGNYGLGLSAADFKYSNQHKVTSQLGSDKWTDQETFLLLEGIMLHGDDWNSVVQRVGTKNEADCVMKLVQLPFGEHFMGNAGIEGNDRRSSNLKNENKVNDQAFSLKDSSAQNYQEDDNEEERHTTEEDIAAPPLKYRCLSPIEDASNPIMSQVAFLSTMVGPRVAAAAAEAAVAALCQEDPSASHILNSLETSTRKECELEESKREPGGNDRDTKDIDSCFSTKKLPPPNLQIRAAIGTALGAAAAHTKLLADQEEREMEHLISIVIENQGSKLDTGAQISSLFLQEDEFIVLIPFAKKQCLNNLSINDMTTKVVSSGKDHKHMLNSGNEQSKPHISCNLLEANSQISGSHTQAVADAAWHDIISDLTVLSNSLKPSQDVQYSTATESIPGKNFELHGNKESYNGEHMDISLNSSSSFDEVGNSLQRKYLKNKRTGMNSINCQELAVTGVLTRNAESACVEILGEKKFNPGRHSIGSKECSLADTQVDYSPRLSNLVRDTDRELNTLWGISKKKPEMKDDCRKRRKVFSYPPALQRPIKIFSVLNTVYGFLQKQHMQATWGNIRESLKQLSCHAFEEVSVKEIEQLAALCPKVVVLSGRVGNGEELTFSINLLDSSGLQMHEQLHILHDAIPEVGNRISDRAIINAITKCQNAFEVHLLEVIKYWQECKTSSRKTLDSVTLEELVLSAKDMCQTTSKSGMEESAARPFPRMPGGHNKQYHCSETNELTPFDMVEHLSKGLGSSGQLVHVETINPRKAKYGDHLMTFSESTKAALRRMGIAMLYSHQAEAIRASLSHKDVVVATSTASGKSLCYNIPVLEELSTNRLSCALYLFPTKGACCSRPVSLRASHDRFNF